MNVLIDTNVIVDVLLRREPLFEDSELVLLASDYNYINGYVSASAITDIFYVISKFFGDKSKARDLIKNSLIGTISIATVDSDTITEALDASWDDFEDCVQYVTGERISADYIVTRNTKDFTRGTIKAITPKELLNIIAVDR